MLVFVVGAHALIGWCWMIREYWWVVIELRLVAAVAVVVAVAVAVAVAVVEWHWRSRLKASRSL